MSGRQPHSSAASDAAASASADTFPLIPPERSSNATASGFESAPTSTSSLSGTSARIRVVTSTAEPSSLAVTKLSARS